MKFKKRRHILSRLSVLDGEEFRYISRAGTTITLGFGEDVPCIGYFKNETGQIVYGKCLKAKHALHVQCIFSINRKNKTLLSQDDLCKPSRSFKKSGKDFDTEPDEIGNTKYDQIIEKHSHKLGCGETVTNIDVTKFGDLVIELTNGFYVLVIPYRKHENEAWRFFDVGNTKSHLVVTCKKILER